MMRMLTLFLTIFTFTAMIGAGTVMIGAGPVQAASLGELRASGAIGERHDGYTVVRNDAAGAAAVVAEVNAQRREIYQTRATQQNTSVAAVGAVYASQIFANAPAGTWFLSSDGTWRQK